MFSSLTNEFFLNSSKELVLNSEKNGFQDFPSEIIFEIFKNLNGEDHDNVSLVCKYWHSHIRAMQIEPMNFFVEAIRKIGLKHFNSYIVRPFKKLESNSNPKIMEAVLIQGLVNLKLKNLKVDMKHPFLTDRILSISQLLFRATICLRYLLKETPNIFYRDATLPNTENSALKGLKRCCNLMLYTGFTYKAFPIIKKIPRNYAIKDQLLLTIVIDFLKRGDVHSALEACNLITNLVLLYSSYTEFSVFFAHHGDFEKAMEYVNTFKAEGIYKEKAEKACKEIFCCADMETSLKMILKVHKTLYLDMFELILLNHSNNCNAMTIVDLIEKYVNKKYRINFFENLCKNLVLKNNAKLAKAIANSFSKKSKRKDYCYYGISKGLILSYRLLKSVKAAKLIENKKLKIEILKYNALDYANEKIYGLYNNNQDMLNADLLNELSILINAIPSKKERKAVLEIVVKYYHHCKVNDLGLKQIREALNKSSK